jgi:hypothetical protein
MTEAYDSGQVAALVAGIDEWLEMMRAGHEHIVSIERTTNAGPGGNGAGWYIRMSGEEKEFITVALTLGQRTLQYRTYVMGAPEENHAQLYENVLRRNNPLVGARFSIGVEDALFLCGEMPVGSVTLDELDRAIGTLYSQVELCFQALLRIGFASKFST